MKYERASLASCLTPTVLVLPIYIRMNVRRLVCLHGKEKEKGEGSSEESRKSFAAWKRIVFGTQLAEKNARKRNMTNEGQIASLSYFLSNTLGLSILLAAIGRKKERKKDIS